MGTEHDIHPIIGTVPALIRETTDRTIGVHTVKTGDSVGRGVQRRAVNTTGFKVVGVIAVVACVGMVGSDINGVCTDRYGNGKEHLLPTGGALAGKCGCSQQRTAACPEVTNVWTDVSARLVEANAVDISDNISAELHSQFH